MFTENLSTLKIHKLTQAQYDRELEAGRLDDNAIYLTPDEEIDLSGQINGHNNDENAHTDIRAMFTGLASEQYVDTKVADLVNSAPEKLNTLDELAAALGDDENFANTVTGKIASKQDKITGTTGQMVGFDANGNAVAQNIPVPDVSEQINAHNINENAHEDIRSAIPTTLSDLTGDSTHRTVTDAEKTAWNAKSTFSGNYNDLTNKPTIPSAYTHPSTHAASMIAAGTFSATGVCAKTGTDYTTARVRNIKASTTDLTAGSSSLSSGDIYIVYE